MKDHKGMTNLEIAELLRDVAASYQLKDEKGNKFKIVAYQRAADAVEHATSELKDLWDDGKLEEVPGIGPSIAKHLDSIFRTGSSKHFEEVMKGLPPSMFELMKVPGIGAKTGFKLSKELGINSLNELESAAKKGEISKLAGFGEESQKDILRSIEETKAKGEERRLLLPYATQTANEVISWMKQSKEVERIDTLGSLRREAATIGDIDLAVATRSPEAVLELFTHYPKAQRVLEKGIRTAAIIVPGTIQVDLMVEKPEAYGALLQHFTGSKHHNIALREIALKKGYSLSDYGVKKIRSSKLIKFKTEEDLYHFFGLAFIPPELREDQGEIEAAHANKIPDLVELKDIKGDLQIHSDFDIETSHDIGASSMKELVKRGGELGYEYLAFTEHNPSRSKHSDSQILELLKRKRDTIEQLTYSRVKKVFNSLEIDIMQDGRLSIPDSALSLLDFALVSIHSVFGLKREEMTKRILSALAHSKVKIFAHPTARKLNEREGIEIDWPKIFEFCVKNDKWIEINCDPARLDLPDTLVHEAVKVGVKLTLGTDAHHVLGLDNMPYGVSVARRGWAEAKDIINTRTLQELEKLLI